MDIGINIDKNSGIPIYVQILAQITTMVKNNILKAGDKLPPERDLANELDVARGTVIKAYKELEKNKVVEVIQGSGTYISRLQDILEADRKEMAVTIINELLSKLESMNFTQREISTLINILINDRDNKYKKVKIATIDCNPEALNIYEEQLGYISQVKTFKYLLDEIYSSKNAEITLENCDIIITTSTHFNELLSKIPAHKNKIMQVAVSPSHQTIIDIASISSSSAAASIGIICKSFEFLKKIERSLKSVNIPFKNVSYVFDGETEDIAAFAKSKTALIIPRYTAFENKYKSVIDEFSKGNGKIIRFDYQIDRGSLIHIEEQIAGILEM